MFFSSLVKHVDSKQKSRREKGGLYCVATLQPNLHGIDKDDEFFTRQEKEGQIQRYYRQRKRIPLCVDHCDAEVWNFVVKERDRIGYVLDLFIGRENAMVVKFRLDPKHAAYAQIYNGMVHRKEAWGVSVWIERLEDPLTGQVTKELTHVALTTTPRFAKYGTYMHRYALTEDKINNIIAREFYFPGQAHCYASREFQTKLQGAASPRI
jgi:hypothetical protein